MFDQTVVICSFIFDLTPWVAPISIQKESSNRQDVTLQTLFVIIFLTDTCLCYQGRRIKAGRDGARLFDSLRCQVSEVNKSKS